MKKNLTSLEIAAVVNELQYLVRGKIDQIYNTHEELLLQLHIQNFGKQLLKIIPGKIICLTKNKDISERPTGFSLLLRKHISNATIKSIEQNKSERIITIELEKSEKYHLILEMFSKGNVILTDSKEIIIGVWEEQIWKDRSVKPKEKYIYPKSEINWKKVTEKELEIMLNNSEKKKLITSLATEVGLGGVYAEEICKLVKIDKNKLPKETTKEEIKAILKFLKEILKKVEKPKGYSYKDSEEVTPFQLLNYNIKKETDNYSEALDELNLSQKVSPYLKKIMTLKRMIQDQHEAIENLADNITINIKKGELVYENYVSLQKLREIVQEMKKAKGWQEIQAELLKVKKVKKVDLKNKKVTIDL